MLRAKKGQQKVQILKMTAVLCPIQEFLPDSCGRSHHLPGGYFDFVEKDGGSSSRVERSRRGRGTSGRPGPEQSACQRLADLFPVRPPG